MAEQSNGMRALALRAVMFIVLFFGLQALWGKAQGSWIERLWIDQLTVTAATAVIGWISPEARAVAAGPRIEAPGGGLNILNGCEGTEVLFLQAAAIAVAPLGARLKLTAMLCGIPFVFAINQLRIVALFYAFRSDRALFDLLHTLVAPLLLVAATGLFFHAWLRRADDGPGRPAEPGPA